ncbi:MAG TPA: hypothetical protein VFQ84_09165 [Arenimonas sp.]|uniref:hypothetical protein n=1 Tax=Arenimonas sp. TaxID=1872635 RepID=UPI002D7F4E8C|nr:hypothetical protein [Arenimonas sp.]HEU0153500.1 hypothetical protein [Arenimonas sp.]
MRFDDESRLIEHPEALRATVDLATSLKGRVGGQRKVETPCGADGSYQIDTIWEANGQVDLVRETDDPRRLWFADHIHQVETIRNNARQPTPKLAAELGINKGWVQVHDAFSRIHELNLQVQLKFECTTLEIPTISRTEASSIKETKIKATYVDGPICGVGAINDGYVAIWVRGRKDPVHLLNGNEDDLHEMRKRGTIIRGTIKKQQDGYVINEPIFISVGRQAQLDERSMSSF